MGLCRRSLRSTASYDVRVVVRDVVDVDSFLEVRPHYAPNLVTAYGTLAGRPVGIVANQPQQRAGTLDIEASRKAARFVATTDFTNPASVTASANQVRTLTNNGAHPAP